MGRHSDSGYSRLETVRVGLTPTLCTKLYYGRLTGLGPLIFTQGNAGSNPVRSTKLTVDKQVDLLYYTINNSAIALNINKGLER